jgi:hypothetical protein
LCESWQSDYAGEDATGKHVIGLWKFDGNQATDKIEDASGNKHTGTLHDLAGVWNRSPDFPSKTKNIEC